MVKSVILIALFLAVAFADYTEEELKTCRDRETKLCRKWKKDGFCESKDKQMIENMKSFCEKTCGYCSDKALCDDSPFGCCWDRVNEALGPFMEGCRPCVDKHPICFRFKTSCKSRRIQLSCPGTCGLCPEKITFGKL